MNKLLSLWILSAAALAAQTVEGVVINSATGKGIGGVSVNLLGNGQIDYRATTDASGHFRMDAVTDGSYLAFYITSDYVPVSSDQNRPFQVTAGAGPVELEYKVSPKVKISGRVLDAAGKPVANATLTLTRTGPASMTYMFDGDANGNYYGPDALQPGSWLLSATAPSSWPLPEPRDGERLGWARTYYPGVTDPALAVPVVVSSAVDLSNLNVKLVIVPVHRVSGVVLDLSGNPVPKVSVELIGHTLDGSAIRPSTSSDDGVFEFATVPAGEYRVATAVNRDGVRLRAVQTLQMKDRDLEDVKLRLTAPFSMPGKVVMEVPEGQPAPKFPRVALEHSDLSSGFVSGQTAPIPVGTPNEKGDLTFSNVYPGPYLIDPNPGPPPYYLDSIRMGGVDALEPDVPISLGAGLITVTYKLNGGTVRGTVEACGSGAVLLVPQDPLYRRDGFTYRTQCGEGGRFEISAIRPGEYYGVALPKGAQFDQSLINQAARVSVRPNEATDAGIRMVK